MHRFGQVLAGERILNESGRHAERRKSEANVEPKRCALESFPSPSGQCWAQERTNIYADVENGKSGIAFGVFFGVERTDQNRGVTLEPARTNSNEEQTNYHTGNSRYECESYMTRHNTDGGVEQSTLGT